MRLSRFTAALSDAGILAAAPSPFQGNGPGPDPDIVSLHYRAQDVRPGGLFFAVEGLKTDGHRFIGQAVANGACAVVMEKPVPCTAPGVRVTDTRKAMSVVADLFFGMPSRHLCLIGITGTNGKTTTACLIEAILKRAGRQVGVLGTIGYRYAGRSWELPVTTPEAVDLHRILSDMVRHGVTHAVMEISSHAIDLHRIDHCRLDVAVFTNLTQDHLDYHEDMASYWECKKSLFTRHLVGKQKKASATAVMNCDDPRGRSLCDTLTVPVIRVGRRGDEAVSGHGMRIDIGGIHGTLDTPAGSVAVDSRLIGAHNVENILCAVGTGVALAIPPSAISSGIADAKRVPGRLEPVAGGGSRSVFVDYAHTPDALENVLSALRPLTPGRIVCVFGCGGDRDRTKRPLMGKIAARLADLTVVTSDNPRSEDPRDIIAQILDGIVSQGATPHAPAVARSGHTYAVEPDRRSAIAYGIEAAQPGDVVLIAGKGHETRQRIGDTTIEFDDRKVAARILSERGRKDR